MALPAGVGLLPGVTLLAWLLDRPLTNAGMHRRRSCCHHQHCSFRRTLPCAEAAPLLPAPCSTHPHDPAAPTSPLQDACIDLLIGCGRLPEAAFFARTYAPSRMTEVVKLWQGDLAKINPKAAESLANPDVSPTVQFWLLLCCLPPSFFWS